MEYIGQRYKVSVDNLTLATSPSAYDLILFAPASNIPFAIDHMLVTAAQTTGTILRAVLMRRSTASTGGTAVVPTPAGSPAAPAASTTVTYLNTSTVGTASGTPLDSQEWNELAPYEYDVRPNGDLIVPGTWLCLYLPVAPGAGIQVSFTAEFTEYK
jgi:hypothetical protein